MPSRRKPAAVPPGFTVLPPVSRFFATLGKVYVRPGADGTAPVYGLHVRPKHANRHGTGHGGFLATLADTFMAAFVHETRRDVGTMWTVRLEMEYKRPAPMGGWLEGHCTGIERAGNFVTVRCELRCGETVTNRATAVFKVSDRAVAGATTSG
ncbi:PaaI family thioesterase [Ferrovibrio xuzhouensis]|uniref:PaaI family thioesterase n=1 Tax=Ferrovibrio xuzhouensis TaxID=1576914 RepID=A0ABV7VEC6_9PROT